MNIKKESTQNLVILVISIVLMCFASYGFFNNINEIIYEFIISFKNDNLTSLLKTITLFGKEVVIIASIGILLIFIARGKYKKGLGITGIVLGSYITNVIFKNIFKNERPNILRLTEEGGYSLPSGHSMAAMSFGVVLMYLISKSNLTKKAKNIIYILTCTIILLVGISRIYLGVHYFSDVLCGYLLSFAVAKFGILIYEKINKEEN